MRGGTRTKPTPPAGSQIRGESRSLNRAQGLRPIDGPFGDFTDDDGFNAQANRAACLGCEGKWAIHPKQIVLANTVYSPSEEEVTKAKRIIEAMVQKAEQVAAAGG